MFVSLSALYIYHAPPSVTIRSVTKPAHSPTKIPNIRISFVVPLSSMEGHAEEEGKTDNLNRYNEDMYKQVKTHSIQLSRLADMVESLESQVKQLQETTKLRKHKTTSVRNKSTSNNSIKTKKKTDRRGSTRSTKK